MAMENPVMVTDTEKRMNKDITKASEEFVNDAPLVSVVIPVYNVSRYLPQCLDGVIAQTYRNLEILIVDDGSTDDSGSICDRYANGDDRIRVFHTPNRGLASARNLALENVEGQYISFIDSDDWIERHAIETLLRAARLTGSDIVEARYYVEYVGNTVHSTAGTKYSHTFHGEAIMSAFAEGWIDNMVWNKLYRAECFTDVRFPVGRTYEDVAIVWKLLKDLADHAGIATVLSDELFHYRIRKGSISNSWTPKNTRDSWTMYGTKFEVLSDYPEKPLAECFRPIYRMWRSYHGYSKEEKAEVKDLVLEMQAFSKKHFLTIMKGDYSNFTKLTCLLSQSKSAPAMWIGYYLGNFKKVFKDRKYRMFD